MVRVNNSVYLFLIPLTPTPSHPSLTPTPLIPTPSHPHPTLTPHTHPSHPYPSHITPHTHTLTSSLTSLVLDRLDDLRLECRLCLSDPAGVSCVEPSSTASCSPREKAEAEAASSPSRRSLRPGWRPVVCEGVSGEGMHV